MDATNTLPQIAVGQAAKEATANALLAAASPAMFGAHDPSTSGGLTVGYLGGRYGGNLVANGTELLAASDITYMVADLATGAISFDTDDTDWNDAANFGRCYLWETDADGVIDFEDHRGGPLGILVAAAVAGSGDMALASVQTVTGEKTFGVAGDVGKLKVAGNTSGAATIEAPAVAGAIVVTLPSSTSTLATIADVSAAVNGLSWKAAVRVATTANGTLASAFENGATVDGVTLATGDRILIKNQSSGSENGIYVVAVSGAPTRAADADSGTELVNASVYVSEGTTLADTQWTCTTNAAITVGSTSITFAQISASSVAIGSVTGLGTGVATFLATPSSANLAAAVTDESGSAGALLFTGGALGTPASGNLSSCTADGTDAVGFRNIPANSQSTAYTAVLADAGKSIDHPSTDANARTFTIPANSSVAYPVGTALSFSNMTSQVVTIAITTDTMYLAGTGTTGSRSLAQYGTATARKLTSTTWLISGVGLT